MIVVAHLSDTHLDGSPGRADRLRRTLDRATGGSRPVDAVVLSGDVAADGTPAQYAQAADLLAASPVPVLSVPGNHDDPAAFAAGLLGLAGGLPPGRVEHLAGARFVLLDSTVPGADGGALSTAALDVLDRALRDAADGGGPVFVVLHHPPVPLGNRSLDAMALADAPAFAAVLTARPGATAVLAGHVHSATVSSVAGVPLVVAPGVASTFRLPWEPAAGTSFVDDGAPPGLAFHVLDDTGRLTTAFRAVV